MLKHRGGERRGGVGPNRCNTLLAETSYSVEDAEETGAAGEPGATGCAPQILQGPVSTLFIGFLSGNSIL